MPRINSAKTFSGVKYATETWVTAKGYMATEDYVSNSLIKASKIADLSATYMAKANYLDSNSKLVTSILPDLAITQVYTTVDDGTSTVVQLLKAAIGGVAEVQSGDVVIITKNAESTVQRANSICGTYMFVNTVATASIADTDYKKLYVPAGNVVSVNSQTADANGNITLNIANIGNVTGITSLEFSNSELEVNNTAIASKGYVDGQIDIVEASISAIKTALGDSADPASGTVYYRLNALETWKTAVDSSISDLKAKVGNIETTVEDLEIFSFAEETKQFATVDKVASVDISESGIQILYVKDDQGNVIYPDIQYSAGKATLTANFDESASGTWKIVKARFTKPTVA